MISNALAAFAAAGGKNCLGLAADDVRAAAVELLDAASTSSNPDVATPARHALDAIAELRHWTTHYARRLDGAGDDWLVLVLRASDRYEHLTAVLRTAMRQVVVAVEHEDAADPTSQSASPG